jgi:hypothetical protein
MHFSVIVFGNDIDQALAPFQATNMGPIAEEWMEKIDLTEEVREAFHARQLCFQLSDGRLVDWRQAHHCDPTTGRMVLVHGAIAVEMTADEARTHHLGFATLDDAADSLGAQREADKFFIEDNFNSQWDWWVIGGRYGSALRLLPGRRGYTETPLEFRPEYSKIFNRRPSAPWQPKPGYCDQTRKMDVDWMGMRAEAGAKAGARWDRVQIWTKGEQWSPWAGISAKFIGDLAREHYASQPAIKAISEGQQTLPPEQRTFLIDDALLGTREDYVSAAELSAGVPHAVVINHEWLSCDMSDQEIGADWNKRFHEILDQVPDEFLITMIDCHV